jgi:hypothetical protein
MNFKKYIKFLPLFIAFPLMTAFVDAEDCEDEDFLDECAEVIDGFKFLKANKIAIESDGEVEYKSVFSKGSTYMLTACNGGEGSMKVTLYDRNKKKVMSNLIQNKYYPAVTYPCLATGVYYLKYEFTAGSGCGVGIIGFKK